jgi:hypothetical protein
VGAAYDIFGNGQTAVKVSLGRYQAAQGSDIAIANNPANAIVTAASRTWNDANRDYVPQESELGPLSNNQFGTVVINTRYDPEIITGWANRPYNWQGAASLQQQLRPYPGQLQIGGRSSRSRSARTPFRGQVRPR